MKYIVIILFFILILIITSRVEIDVKKLEIINNKVRFSIKTKIYIFKYILLFSKKIKKKDIIKSIKFFEVKDHVQKGKKIIRKLPIKLSEISLELDYGIKYLYPNIYSYAILNAAIPILINRYSNSKTKVRYNISTDFKRNYLHSNISGKLEIKLFNLLYAQK